MKCFLIAMFILASVVAAEEPIRVSDDFEKWEWKPITHSIRRDGKKRIAEKRELNFEYRGPLYRGPVGFILPAGVIVEGDEAFKGSSVMLTDCQVGLHGRYSHKIRPESTYNYSLGLKGHGTFRLRVWVRGIDVKSGEQTWLGFPNVIEIEATDSWQTRTGTFELPAYKDSKYRIQKALSAAIVIDAGDRIYLDNFSIEERIID